MDTARPDPPPPQHAARVSFGALLRDYRLAAGLSQEELENGRRQAPYRHTVALLARALGLSRAEPLIRRSPAVHSRG
jgi:hypothetical protein